MERKIGLFALFALASVLSSQRFHSTPAKAEGRRQKAEVRTARTAGHFCLLPSAFILTRGPGPARCDTAGPRPSPYTSLAPRSATPPSHSPSCRARGRG